jgi:DNA-binding SARP family transcriptional activator
MVPARQAVPSFRRVERFRLLGALEIRVDEQWREINAPKWRSVLAALLINAGQVVSVNALIDEVWGDAVPAKASNLISIYVLRLRRLLGEQGGARLVTRSPGYQLHAGPSDTDVGIFEAMFRDGRDTLARGQPDRAAAQLAEALAMWRGSPLSDVPRTALVEAEVERLSELRLSASELRITAELACGEHAAVVPDLRRLLADSPLREGLWALLITALNGSGRHAEALDAYGQARAVIADELGVDPGLELRRLYAGLLAEDTDGWGLSRPLASPILGGQGPAALPSSSAVTVSEPPPSPVVTDTPARSEHVLAVPDRHPAQLPADVADFTGREDQVKHLSDLLSAAGGAGASGAVRIALVAGYGGLGKTSLAVHAAHRAMNNFPDGQLYVDLLGATAHPLQPADVLTRFLHDLGVDGRDVPHGEADRAALYRTSLAGRRVLVVLDNAKDAAQVRPLLPGSASCAVLITTRSRMPDLAGTNLVDLNVLDDDEALTLFTKIVGDERALAEPEATAELLLACAGLPLAIRICAARLTSRSGWTIQTMANRLRDQHRRLDELIAGDLAVRASFEVSFASLPKARRHAIDPALAFRLLGLWHGPAISRAAAAALFGTTEDQALDALEILVDAHLLESKSQDLYKFHDLLRVYASERAYADLSQEGRDTAVQRLLSWYMSTAGALRKPDEIAWLLDTLNQAGASEAITALLAHDPAAHASLDDPQATAQLLRTLDTLDTAAARDAFTTLAHRVSAYQKDSDRPAAALSQDQAREQERVPEMTDDTPSHRQTFAQDLAAALNRANLTAAEAAGAAGVPADLAEAWCSGEQLPALTVEGLAGLRAILAACGITAPGQILAWTDTLIQLQAPSALAQDLSDQPPLQSAPPFSDPPGRILFPDPLEARTPDQFLRALSSYRAWSGAPSLRKIERACGHEISIATMSSSLRGAKLPPLRTVQAIVRGCGGTPQHIQRFTDAWQMLRISPDSA